jgi:hypothetical protein
MRTLVVIDGHSITLRILGQTGDYRVTLVSRRRMTKWGDWILTWQGQLAGVHRTRREAERHGHRALMSILSIDDSGQPVFQLQGLLSDIDR